MTSLQSIVAVVTGASRGAGRGIALELGAAGATVYVTGRSARGASTMDLPAVTIDDTAEMVTALGGVGIPVRCDHTVDADVEVLFKQVEEEQDYLDVLVNNIWGGYENYDSTFDDGFWEQPLWRWDKMFEAGVRAHYTASRLAAPQMIRQRSGLIVNTTFWDRNKYLRALPYDVAKAAINRMAYGMALELRPHRVAVVALTPGFMRTEVVLMHFATDEDHWHEHPGLEATESPRYIGRAVAALAADPDVLEKSGRTLTVGDLAREYNFTDHDGRQPPTFLLPDEDAMD